jgi:hypothetical protein
VKQPKPLKTFSIFNQVTGLGNLCSIQLSYGGEVYKSKSYKEFSRFVRNADSLNIAYLGHLGQAV